MYIYSIAIKITIVKKIKYIFFVNMYVYKIWMFFFYHLTILCFQIMYFTIHLIWILLKLSRRRSFIKTDWNNLFQHKTSYSIFIPTFTKKTYSHISLKSVKKSTYFHMNFPITKPAAQRLFTFPYCRNDRFRLRWGSKESVGANKSW